MPVLRKIVTSGVAVAAGLLMVAGTAAAAPPSAAADDRLAAACNVNNYPKNRILKDVWRDAPAYQINFYGNGQKQRKGTLAEGKKRYFYCQKNWGNGYRETVYDSAGRRYTNTWWALTDVPGAARVWVNVVYLTGGYNDQPEPGLPVGT